VNNFVIISPHFPSTYWRFAEALKKNGFNVLGIGDAPYNEISPELRGVLTEYYYCPKMNDYSELYKAFAFFAFKYGKIDWVESNNEYWLASDARLRSDFNIKSGINSSEVIAYKAKTEMKKYFAEADVKVARYIKTALFDEANEFANKVGYPLFAKPDIGVGANSTYRINNRNELDAFFFKKDVGDYIIEEYIDGTIYSFDGISNSKYEPVVFVKHYFPISNASVVNNLSEDYYYSFYKVEDDLKNAGKAILQAFRVYKRFFHLEFFRLNVDKEGLGKKSDLIALEVNMRPPGGFSTDMIAACLGMDIYQVWADIIAFDENRQERSGAPKIVAEVGRRDSFEYETPLEEIKRRYHEQIIMSGRYAPAISVGLGNDFLIAKFDSYDESHQFVLEVLKHHETL
jgi:hypothetical protein